MGRHSDNERPRSIQGNWKSNLYGPSWRIVAEKVHSVAGPALLAVLREPGRGLGPLDFVGDNSLLTIFVTITRCGPAVGPLVLSN